MSDRKLGRLEKKGLREFWEHEATEFTPWLAKEANLAFLGETLGLRLEAHAQEPAVGPFRADILCKEQNDDTWVLIENQLESSDHSHPGAASRLRGWSRGRHFNLDSKTVYRGTSSGFRLAQ